MSDAKPLTREELGRWIRWAEEGDGTLELERIVATVRAAEAERDAASARAEKLRVALRVHGVCRCDMELSSGLRVATLCGRCAALKADDAEREQASDGPPMPHPVAVTFLEALRRDFARDPDSVLALLSADDAERGDS